MGDYDMVYVCKKCEFLFERKNEPSKCPSCENQCIVGANSSERQTFMQLYDNQKDTESHSNTLLDETQ
jgi:DNA-directed RNA polymerase subunit RPC12/RpoP